MIQSKEVIKMAKMIFTEKTEPDIKIEFDINIPNTIVVKEFYPGNNIIRRIFKFGIIKPNICQLCKVDNTCNHNFDYECTQAFEKTG